MDLERAQRKEVWGAVRSGGEGGSGVDGKLYEKKMENEQRNFGSMER